MFIQAINVEFWFGRVKILLNDLPGYVTAQTSISLPPDMLIEVQIL